MLAATRARRAPSPWSLAVLVEEARGDPRDQPDVRRILAPGPDEPLDRAATQLGGRRAPAGRPGRARRGRRPRAAPTRSARAPSRRARRGAAIRIQPPAGSSSARRSSMPGKPEPLGERQRGELAGELAQLLDRHLELVQRGRRRRPSPRRDAAARARRRSRRSRCIAPGWAAATSGGERRDRAPRPRPHGLALVPGGRVVRDQLSGQPAGADRQAHAPPQPVRVRERDLQAPARRGRAGASTPGRARRWPATPAKVSRASSRPSMKRTGVPAARLEQRARAPPGWGCPVARSSRSARPRRAPVRTAISGSRRRSRPRGRRRRRDAPAAGEHQPEVQHHAVAEDRRERALGVGVGDEQLEGRAPEVEDGEPPRRAPAARRPVARPPAGRRAHPAAREGTGPTTRPSRRSSTQTEPFAIPRTPSIVAPSASSRSIIARSRVPWPQTTAGSVLEERAKAGRALDRSRPPRARPPSRPRGPGPRASGSTVWTHRTNGLEMIRAISRPWNRSTSGAPAAGPGA